MTVNFQIRTVYKASTFRASKHDGRSNDFLPNDQSDKHVNALVTWWRKGCGGGLLDEQGNQDNRCHSIPWTMVGPLRRSSDRSRTVVARTRSAWHQTCPQASHPHGRGKSGSRSIVNVKRSPVTMFRFPFKLSSV